MAGTWRTHDAGFFTLEIPSGWIPEQSNGGTLRLRDPQSDISMALLSIANGATDMAAGHESPALMDAESQLQKWIASQWHVRINQPPHFLPRGTVYPTATAEGLQQARTGRPWYLRLFRRERLSLWRYWAIVNPHMLVLASCNGRPEAMEGQRAIINRLMASIQLPSHDILIGRRFTEMVVSLARNWFPQTAVAVVDDVHLQFGSRNISLASLHRRYLASPEELPTQVRAFLATVHGELPASALAHSWAHARDHIMPMFLTRTARQNSVGRIVFEEWINDLSIGYVLLQDETAQNVPDDSASHATTQSSERIITRDDLVRWHIDPEDLHKQALQNLILYSHEHLMEGRKADGITMLSLANSDRHNAARLLLPELHLKLRRHLGATFYAGIPSRDTLFVFSVSDTELLANIRQEIAENFSRDRAGLSPKIFLVTPDGIAGDPARS